MDSTQKFFLLTFLFSGICYSNAREPGKSFFEDPSTGAAIPNPATQIETNYVVRALAEELICGNAKGWAKNFANVRNKGVLKNPCDPGKCTLLDDLSDYKCECDHGSTYDIVTKKCLSSVQCKTGSPRKAADQLIVGILHKEYDWATGIYDRKTTGLPVSAYNQVYANNPNLHLGARREIYEQYERDSTTGLKTEKVIANLYYNMDENHWQFEDLRTNSNGASIANQLLQVTSRHAKRCVEDVQTWTFTEEQPNDNHVSVHRMFVASDLSKSGDTDFQIRDTNAPYYQDTAGKTKLHALKLAAWREKFSTNTVLTALPPFP